ncbi:MAG: hypothetical protein MUE81_00250 [Thermoflexibacter sp.]|jgi:hypothetical protein|nr:hypothetical protein [Thermoflexibacter sp.]
MINFIDKINQIIDNQFFTPHDKGTQINLKGSGECKEIPFEKGNVKTLTISVDKEGFDGHPLLKTIKNLKKYPDYIIFCQKGNQLFVLVAELKSTNSDDWHRQAKAGLAFAQYLVGMLESFEKKIFDIEYRCLLFHTKKETRSMKKGKTEKKQFKYSKHPIFKYQFSDKPCNVKTPYSLEIFLR